MGTGKTTLINALCKQLQLKAGTVSSPTYALVNEYDTAQGTVYHLDLYRLKSLEEAYDIGVEEYVYDPDAWCFIEWPDIIEPLVKDAEFVPIYITTTKQNARKIVIG